MTHAGICDVGLASQDWIVFLEAVYFWCEYNLWKVHVCIVSKRAYIYSQEH